MEENKNKPKIFQTIEPDKSVRVLDTGSEKNIPRDGGEQK
nr:MAG TPA: hypothetical protein [Caudoviricetes sp.]